MEGEGSGGVSTRVALVQYETFLGRDGRIGSTGKSMGERTWKVAGGGKGLNRCV